jgi:hypothetical protein
VAGHSRNGLNVGRNYSRRRRGSGGRYQTGVDEPTDALFDALSHRYRRFTLAALSGRDEPMALADLAVGVAKRETGDTGQAVSKERAREIEISLYHVHVPKLEVAGLVEYDRDRNTVAARRETGQSVRGMA